MILSFFLHTKIFEQYPYMDNESKLTGFDLELQCQVICTRSNQYVTMQQVNRHKKCS